MMRISTAALAAAVVLTLLLWPQSLGGVSAYVTYNQGDIGSTLALGDVAVVRRARAYQLDDLVAVRSSDGPPIFGWVTTPGEGSYWIRFRPDSAPLQVMEPYIIGRLWFNLGDLSRGVTGSVLSYFGIQVASAR